LKRKRKEERMARLKDKKVKEPLTLIVSSRVDIRKFAKIIYVWKMRGTELPDVSSVVRRLIHLYADSLVVEDELGKQVAEDTYSAQGFLISERLMKPRFDERDMPTGRYSGQDRSTHYSKVKQYESDELRVMDKISGVDISTDEESIQRHLKILEEVQNNGEKTETEPLVNPLEDKTGICMVCGGTIDESKFESDQTMRKYFERANKQVCFECLEKQL
jgi:hypothetical protein